MRHDLPAMAAAVTASTALVYVCNPNNPTGTLVPGRELRPFVSELSRRAPVLVDEAYLDLWDDAAEHTCIDRVRAGEAVIVTRTFSKLHGLAGLRIGYAVAPADIIRRLQPLRMSLLNTAGIAAATASYQDLEYQALSRQRLQQSLAITRQALADVGWASHRDPGELRVLRYGATGRASSAQPCASRASWWDDPSPPTRRGAGSAWARSPRWSASPRRCGARPQAARSARLRPGFPAVASGGPVG
jgi:hypothetical protein